MNIIVSSLWILSVGILISAQTALPRKKAAGSVGKGKDKDVNIVPNLTSMPDFPLFPIVPQTLVAFGWASDNGR